ELLPGHYEEWVQPERARLAASYAGALRQLVRCLAQEGDFARALEYAHRATSVDPLSERARRDLMRLHAAAGEPLLALDEYAALEQRLREELSIAPSARTRSIAEQIAAQAGVSLGRFRQ